MHVLHPIIAGVCLREALLDLSYHAYATFERLVQMIVEPEQRVADFAKAGADIISVHAESAATIHLHRTINQIKELGCLAGAVLNPGSSLREIEEVRRDPSRRRCWRHRAATAICERS